MEGTVKDVVIVGGGIAGLAAGWRLRHRDILLIEADDRVGGRIRSEARGPYWLNWGGHVYDGGPASATQRLLKDTGFTSRPVPGNLTGLSMNGRLLLSGRVETFPFRVPMSWGDRASLIRVGAKVRLAVARYARLVKRRPGEDEATRQQRVYDFMNDRSFADFIGTLPEDAEALFKPTVTRSSAEMHQISAGAGIGYFNLVWNIGAGLSHSIDGGPSTLLEGIADALGDRVQLGAAAEEVVNKGQSVVVRYRQNGVEHEVEAQSVILATTASVSHRIGVDLDEDLREALAQVKYGPFVSAAFLTNETERQKWDGTYAIATPKRSFNVVLNMSNNVHGHTQERQPGGSFMTFSPAGLARQLLEQDDETILRTYIDDLDQVLPGFASHVAEAEVARWPEASPYCFPGRGRLQSTFTRPNGRVMLAGDYLGTQYTETSVHTAFAAAQAAENLLDAADRPQRRAA
ncbi:FAD-dependent oxidoreductase [Streptomyces sp. BV286]|uniref:FAD-dependent oxidoreductase n=1 Tax=Streptomyces sp. BV286 TaxID=2849672 RepID=UPI001C2E1ABD|nr:FAD-dependent oxidoreductase [Streptomyces sp. BV286]MBV1935593.1 FAD-dependent oxidoreductase [Streptomyces sp. BV286]